MANADVGQVAFDNEVRSREAMQDFGLVPFPCFSPETRNQCTVALKASRNRKANKAARKARRAGRG